MDDTRRWWRGNKASAREEGRETSTSTLEEVRVGDFEAGDEPAGPQGDRHCNDPLNSSGLGRNGVAMTDLGGWRVGTRKE